MSNMLKDLTDVFGDYPKILIGYIIRILTIFFAGHGITDMLHRQLSIKMSKKTDDAISAIFMIIASIAITVIYHKTTIGRMIWETVVFCLIAQMIYAERDRFWRIINKILKIKELDLKRKIDEDNK